MHSSTHSLPLQDSARPTTLNFERPRSLAKSLEAEAVARAQAGDQDAFSGLYLKHKRRVFSVCMSMVRDYALAEDLTQDTFLQAHSKLASFRGDSVFSTWLHRLAVNTVLMYIRKRALTVVSLDQLMESVPEERAGRNFGTRDLTQAGVIDRLAIERALVMMAPGYRSIFLLHDVHGFDHYEIASMLDCSCGNTKSQLHKARRVLRKALSPKISSDSARLSYETNASLAQRSMTTSTRESTMPPEALNLMTHLTVSAVAT
jgi:RNA polymerase sigma-70 factor (ECF subfamily)